MIAVVFDTETTGLIPNRTLRLDKQLEIIEFYGCQVDLSTGQTLQEFDQLIKPKNKIPDKNIEITGITNEMVIDAPPFESVADKIIDILQSAPLIIAHNLTFDKEAIEIELQRCNKQITWPSQGVCTVEQTEYLKGYRLKLGDLHELLFGERFADAHRAKHDTQALVRCACALYQKGAI